MRPGETESGRGGQQVSMDVMEHSWISMLLHENQVRLTPRERDILFRLTGSDPHYVTTREQLKEWAARYLTALPDDAREIREIKAVLQRYLPF
ncbi:hypothetical protein AU15_20530 [Marinobacter salarius]|uniref:Uncharacterized protein n=4 Tax=Marinobacter TaxID=2742 RepID=W5Z4M9_9GAMM|nr:hypothetical protein AU15_20530 [Marinobacter salarius]